MVEKDWVDCFGVVTSRKKPIMAFTLVCAIAAGIGYFVMPKTYESGLTMDVGIFSVVTKRAGENEETTTDPIEPVQVVRDSITSKPFMAAIISRLNLNTTPDKLKKKVKAKINEDMRDSRGPINRQIIISTKADSPELAKTLSETVAELVIEKHKKLYEQAIENRHVYEKDLEEQIGALDGEVKKLQTMLDRKYDKGGDTASLVLLQADLYDKDRHLSALKRELSHARLMDGTKLKSANTAVTVPAYLPQNPTLSWWMYAAIGLIVGFMVSAGYFITRDALKAGSPGE